MASNLYKAFTDAMYASQTTMSGPTKWVMTTDSTSGTLSFDFQNNTPPTPEERLERLERLLETCVVCGSEAEMFFCTICAEAVNMARSMLLKNMLEMIEEA